MTQVDNILGELSEFFVQSSRRPLFTLFRAKFTCRSCGVIHKTDMWNSRPYSVVPMLTLPSTNERPISAAQLLLNFLSMTFQAECRMPECQQTNDAYYEAKPGN